MAGKTGRAGDDMENGNEVQGMPDQYDRLMGALHGLPEVASTRPSTIKTVTPVVGTNQTFIVQTYRQRDAGDTVFLEVVTKEGTVRLVIPPAVANAIARQRNALTNKTRSMAAKAIAQARKDRGQLPGFMKSRA